MPRPKKAQQAVVPSTALMASAHRYPGKAPRIYAPSKDWQKRAYHHYSMCGEARYAARYFGRAMSRASLYVADRDGKKMDDKEATGHLDALFGGSEGQSEMLEKVGVHLMVAGECYLVGRSLPEGDFWEVISIMEVESGQSGWQIMAEDENKWIPLSDDDTVIRVWNPKPDRRWEADSPFRSMLPVLDEIEWMSRYIHAQATSRLTGAGILVLPEGMTFPPPPPIEGKAQEFANEADAFMMTLGSSMMETVGNPSSPAAMVPTVITAPGDVIGDIKHLTFWTPLDEHARDMRKDAIHRFALGMDLPPEMVLGMGSNEGTGGGNSNGISHWGAWMIEEQAIKLHIEPMLDVLCAAVAGYYLRPLTGGFQTVKADTAALRLRPDRSQEAMELNDRGLIKDSVVVAENGFSVEDMMDEEERKQWLLRKVASGSSTPEQVDAALRALGVELDIREETPPFPAEQPNETPPPPSLEDHPTRPRTPAESGYGTYEVLVLRALERAGNRLRNTAQTRTPGPAYEAHIHLSANGSAASVLEDAWGMAEVVIPDEADREKVVSTLDSYCRTLLANREPHNRGTFNSWCKKAGL